MLLEIYDFKLKTATSFFGHWRGFSRIAVWILRTGPTPFAAGMFRGVRSHVTSFVLYMRAGMKISD